MKEKFRTDEQPYIYAEEAYQHLTGQQEGAEAARLRMLQRMGLDSESGPAADARARMMDRKGLHQKSCDVETARQAMIARRERRER